MSMRFGLCAKCAIAQLEAATLGPGGESSELEHFELCRKCSVINGWKQENPKLQAQTILGGALGRLSNFKAGTSPPYLVFDGIGRDLFALEILIKGWTVEPEPVRTKVCEKCVEDIGHGLVYFRNCENCLYKYNTSVCTVAPKIHRILEHNLYRVDGTTIERDLLSLEIFCKEYLKDSW